MNGKIQVKLVCPNGHQHTPNPMGIEELADAQASPLKCPTPGCQIIAQVVATPRLVQLTDAIRQDKNPPAFLVFCYKDIDHDYMIFPDENSARDFAMEQEEKANEPEDSWPIYALWATAWPTPHIPNETTKTA
jgi:hypothetical protein